MRTLKSLLSHADSIPVHAPVILEAAFGYEGEALCVGFYWEPGGDELMGIDGRRLRTLPGWDSWAYLWAHPLMAPIAPVYNLGSSDEPATHALVVNRRTRHMGITDMDLLEKIMKTQWEPQPGHAPFWPFYEPERPEGTSLNDWIRDLMNKRAAYHKVFCNQLNAKADIITGDEIASRNYNLWAAWKNLHPAHQQGATK